MLMQPLMRRWILSHGVVANPGSARLGHRQRNHMCAYGVLSARHTHERGQRPLNGNSTSADCVFVTQCTGETVGHMMTIYRADTAIDEFGRS
jgi:hypothetical protein